MSRRLRVENLELRNVPLNLGWIGALTAISQFQILNSQISISPLP
jgi:hypothetical protein